MTASRRGRQQKPLLLWCNFAFSPQDRSPRVATARSFRIVSTTLPSRALEDVANFEPAALCFEFDHLDRLRAATLEQVLASNPRIPALMLTVEHSEDLAAWAFRCGVWNYLVKPVPPGELEANVEGLLGAAIRRTSMRMPRPPGVDSPPVSAPTPTDARTAKFEAALQYVRRHYGDKITETEAARRCGMKRFAFSHGFHGAFGVSFRDYVMKTRIGEAQRLLAEGGRSITEIAFATGFTDGSYFARAFRQHTGQRPSEYVVAGPAAFPAP